MFNWLKKAREKELEEDNKQLAALVSTLLKAINDGNVTVREKV